jgi:hypothetical protein
MIDIKTLPIFLWFFSVLILNPAFSWGGISLPGYQLIGDTSDETSDSLPVSFSQLSAYPFYFSLTSAATLSAIQLQNVSDQESNSVLTFYIDGNEVGSTSPGAQSATVNNLSLSAGLHTLMLRGRCYNNGEFSSCSVATLVPDLSVADLAERFVDPTTYLNSGNLNTSYSGTNQTDSVEIAGNANRSIDLQNGDDRLYIHGANNSAAWIDLGNGADMVRIGGNKNAAIDLGSDTNQCQIDGNANSGDLSGGNQSDTVKVKGSVYASVDLSGGDDQMEILGNLTAVIEMGNGEDQLYVHGNVSGSGVVDMGGGNDVARIDGNINVTVDGGNGTDTLYVNMTESQWASSSQSNNVSGFETVVCTDTGMGDSGADDFSFDEIILVSSDTTDAIHFLQKYHLGDDTDAETSGNGNGWGWGSGTTTYDGYDPTDSTPYYPDITDGSEVTLSFTLPQAVTFLTIDFYRLRGELDDNSVYIDGVEVESLASGSDLATTPYTITVDGDFAAGTHTLKIDSNRQGWFFFTYDDFSWDEIIITPELSLSEIDHLEIIHDDSAIACIPEEITIRACANEDCTSLYTEGVIGTLTAGGNAKGFSISAPESATTVALYLPVDGTIDTDPQSVTLALQTTPTIEYICKNIAGGETLCSVDVYKAGFIFDVPDLISGKTTGEVSIQAIGTDPDNPGSCVAVDGFVGEKGIDFWSDYINPAKETKPIIVSVDGVPTDVTSTSIPITLTFTSAATASFTVNYPDAGEVQLNASYTGTAGTEEELLEMVGDDTFIARPVGLCVYSDDPTSDCTAADTVFKKTGESFNLGVKGVCWEADDDTDFCSGNGTTENFQLGQEIKISSNLIAPEKDDGGFDGDISVKSIYIVESDNGDHVIEQAVSEVGVFTFSATGGADDDGNDIPLKYFGEELPVATSACIGRFIPDHFIIESNTSTFANSCSSFTYMGQPFYYAMPPTITITAVRYDKFDPDNPDHVTKNYGGDFWKLDSDLSRRYYTNQSGSAATLSVSLDADNATLTGDDDYDGSGTFALDYEEDGDMFTYERQSVEELFDANIQLTIPAVDLTDADGVCYYLNDDVCDDYIVSNIIGTEIRFGRLRLNNANGSELLPLSIPIYAEYFYDGAFVFNKDDTCTQVTDASESESVLFDLSRKDDPLDVTAWKNADQSIVLVDGGGSTNSLGFAEADNIPASPYTLSSDLMADDDPTHFVLKAPGFDLTGYIFLRADLSDYKWLQFDWDNEDGLNDGPYDDNPTARATFGIYKGSETIIYLRETTWR